MSASNAAPTNCPVSSAVSGRNGSGVSVTMPGKFAALRFADERTERAELVGAANTLLRTPSGWRADNTDVDGVAGALRAEGLATGAAVVTGSGGTAPAAIVAWPNWASPTSPSPHATRTKPRVWSSWPIGSARPARFCDLNGGAINDAVAAAGVAGQHAACRGRSAYAEVFAGVPVLLDAIYDPWPTPLASAVAAAGGRVISGLQMLLHQAFAQVEQFTGLPAPRAAMAAALD